MTAIAEERDAYRASFERFAAAHAGSDPAWLRERRTAAMARFVEKGLPTARDEAWRHTPVAPLARPRFDPAGPAARLPADALDRLPREGFRGSRLVFVNGRFSADLSSPGRAEAGIEVASLRELLRAQPDRVEPWLGRVCAGQVSVFADLNAAFAEDGAVVIVAPGQVVREPVLVAHLSAGNGNPSVSYPRSLVVARPGSECRVVETFTSPNGSSSLVNAVTEVVVEEGARVDHYKLQQEGEDQLHVAALAARLARDARLFDHSLALGAALSRNDIDVRFDGEGGECALHGLFVLDGRRVADTHSRIDHARPHCSSREHYRGIVDGQARGIFNGLVVVRPGAQKTDAFQMNQNLLLSRQALVHSTPQLQILADDVKCKHGSTTGQLDPAALFYLRSRGLSEPAARSLLTWAFASDIVRKMDVEPLRRIVERHLQAHLPGVSSLAEAVS
ncbi:MAG TPA: Fe-S cluster assembly protein SufD [Vicinamibacteria bacterium]|nr:Fe-S cluster assembly protein SufD [Vicinamibacteria bacterium]